MKFIGIKIIYIIAVLFACLRPTIIGTAYSAPVCAIILMLSFFLFIKFGFNKNYILNNKIYIQLSILFFLSLYIFIRSLFLKNNDGFDAIKGYLIWITTIFSLTIIFNNKEFSIAFFDAFAFFLFLSCFSLIITFILFNTGVNPKSLIIMNISLSGAGYGDNFGAVAFPFTGLYNEVASWFGSSTRLSGIFREPGVLPPFACWTAAYASMRRWPLYMIIIPLIASVLSLSTIGPLSLYTGACLLLYRLRVHPILVLVIICAVLLIAWPILYNLDYIGLENKMKSESYEDREMLFLGVLYTENILVGDGTGWGGILSREGISLISQIRVYGLFYFIPVVLFYLCAMRNLALWVAGCVPALIAITFSQPISVDPAFLVIFLAWVVFEKPNIARYKSR